MLGIGWILNFGQSEHLGIRTVKSLSEDQARVKVRVYVRIMVYFLLF